MSADGMTASSFPLASSGAIYRGATHRGLLLSLSLVGAVTLSLALLTRVAHLPDVSIIYLIPVLISATRWGMIPAIVSAVGGVAAAAFFFYPPLYDLRVSNPQQIMDLFLFICVAVVTGQLADGIRGHIKAQKRTSEEVRALYAFSRRLAVASTVDEIHAAIRDHFGLVLGYRVLLFEGRPEEHAPCSVSADKDVPEAVRAAILQARQGQSPRTLIFDEHTGSAWLVSTVSRANPRLGIVAIDLGESSAQAPETLSQVEAPLHDAAATLERLDVARVIDEVKARLTKDTLRDALIGSVSHELRTPLAAILGAATVLSQFQAVTEDRRLSELADVIRTEAERLSGDIQNLLDASRISSNGLRPHLAWTDPADLVNAAIERRRRRICEHEVRIAMPDELPLTHVDPVLTEQALGQIVDNAAKYSPPGSVITITVREERERILLCVKDEGMGLTVEEMSGLFGRFCRAPRHRAAVAGSGLGLWIARAFVTAAGGEMTLESAGAGQGTTVTISLPGPGAGESETRDRHE